ncbi:hypothetical protein [Demequina sediminicola]|uniref:hypothetical protein n=1 Tax=Demequina sediminicola TaxID=1095026 RepID=UPI000AFAFC9F|nr:hypothetical protein [Demequina sediminicola]
MKYSKRQIAGGLVIALFTGIGLVTAVMWIWPFDGARGTLDDPVPIGQSATLTSIYGGVWEITLTTVSSARYEDDPGSIDNTFDPPSDTGVCWFIFGTARQTNGDEFKGAPGLTAAVTASDEDYDIRPSHCSPAGPGDSPSTLTSTGLDTLAFPDYYDLYGYLYPEGYWKTHQTYSFYATVWTESYEDPPTELRFDDDGKKFYFSLEAEPGSHEVQAQSSSVSMNTVPVSGDTKTSIEASQPSANASTSSSLETASGGIGASQ